MIAATPTPVGQSNSTDNGKHKSACLSLGAKLDIENTTVTNISYVPAGTNSSALTMASLCRVQLQVNTSSTSQLKMEAWLPDEFYGRFLATGNGGLNGCFTYPDMVQGSLLHFATVGTNNGHDGDTAQFFLNNPEVFKDFVYRSVETEVIVGKQIMETYYGKEGLGKSYYTGCSTGGRQGFRAVQQFPSLFDGVIAGAPAIDWNHLIGYVGVFSSVFGLWSEQGQGILSDADLDLITADALAQCDTIDGLKDGIIDDPDRCDYRPENLLCSSSSNSSGCLTPEKVEAVTALFSPLYGTSGELLSPSSNELAHYYVRQWYTNVIFNDTSYNGENFSIADVEYGQSLDPSGISTFNTDLRPFRERGGKLLTFHGLQDYLIPSGTSLRYYNSVARTLDTPKLDDFYRLFQIPGMQHCTFGPGAWQFGQSGSSPIGLSNSSSHQILLALVDWVEGGVAPDTIVGTKFVNDDPEEGVERQRSYCPYPARSVLKQGGDPTKADDWECDTE